MSNSIHITAGSRTLVSIDNFEIPENHITLLLGESGIGKSLIAKSLYGLLDSDELTITIDGKPYRNHLDKVETKRLQYESFVVFQEPSSHLNPLMTLSSQIREGSLASSPNEETILSQLWRNSTPADVQKLFEVYPKPHRPSGGEKQRVLLAMAFKKIDALLAKGHLPTEELFVFDEPTGSLDNAYRDLFLDMLVERFRIMNFTCLIITHDYSMMGKIHETYKDVLDKVSFKELTLYGEGVKLQEFKPKLYLDWLHDLKPQESKPDAAKKLLLKSESGAQVFDRALGIFRDKAFTTECPLVLHAGDLVYLKAASGVGKTSLVKLLMGLFKADRLDAQLDGIRLTEHTPRSLWQKSIWGKKMTMVFQHADEALNPESTVRGVFGGLPTLQQPTDSKLTEILSELFEMENLAAFLNKKVKHLSGGQKQRLNLLRGFALDTDILILDEPLNGLDFESSGKVIELIQRKQNSGKGILLISHNEEIFDKLVSNENLYYLKARRVE
jgi:ABC-type glutathione transport system ATPase component